MLLMRKSAKSNLKMLKSKKNQTTKGIFRSLPTKKNRKLKVCQFCKNMMSSWATLARSRSQCS